MKRTEIYIDLGTSNTLIYVRGKGFVLNEPSCLTVRQNSKHSRELFALGRPAKKMLGKAPEFLGVHKPLHEGVIASLDLTVAMLSGFLKRAREQVSCFRPSILISLPCRVTKPEEDAVKHAAQAQGARLVELLDEPVAAAIGAKLPILSPVGSMVVDIGGGTTEIAIIACGGIIHANAVRIGGNNLDEAIITYLKKSRNFLIGEQTAELLKLALSSALPDKFENRIEVGGKDSRTLLPSRCRVSGRDVYEAITPVLDQIIVSVKQAIAESPPEIVADISEKGLILAGGGALLSGLDKRIEEVVGIKARLAPEPLYSIAQGGAAVLENSKLRDRVLRVS